MSNAKLNRRGFLLAAAGAAAVAMSGAARATPAGSAKGPLNVLFLMSDDMRPELACYGSRFNAHSPNIDKLASAGVRFDRNYCQFPLCNPSRSSLFTGRKPVETGVLGNAAGVRELHPDWVTLPQLFRENGYTTLRAGKLFHAGLDDPKAWTEFDGDAESMHPTAKAVRMNLPRVQVPRADGSVPPLPAENARGDHSDQILVLESENGVGAGDYLVAERAMAMMDACAKAGKPFFVGCGFSKPHSPPEAPRRFFDMYNPAKLTLPPDFAAWPTVPPGFPAAAIRPKNADLFIGRGATPEEAREVIRAYLASISWADWNLGRVLAHLDALGLRDNTLVVFVADHGYQLGEKGKWSKAGSLFEGGTRVPLIVHMPGAKGNGRVVTRTVESQDLYRTVAELAGLPVPAGVGGTSLVPLLENPSGPWDKPAYSVWSEDGKTVHGTAVRTEQWRYAEFGAAGRNGAMLFDVHADPLELRNLADEPAHAQTRAKLSGLIAAYTPAAMDETTPKPLRDMTAPVGKNPVP